MTEGLESLGRVRLQGIILLVVAFAVGVLAGVAGERALWSARRPAPPLGQFGPEPGGRPGFGREMVPALYEQLDLSDQQREEIRSIFETYRPQSDSLLQEYFPRIRALMDSARLRVRDVLTPEQRARLDTLLPDRFPGRMPRGRGGPRPPGGARGPNTP